jgi:glycerophosphoryl diester phosphodiesterase
MKTEKIYIAIIIFNLIILTGFAQDKIIAHRGASSIAPENTLTAFSKAIDLGVSCIEVDIRLSKDDSVMVIHDETLDRTTNGSGKVSDFSYQNLKNLSAGYASKFGSEFNHEQIPSLFEVLQLANGKVNVCIDLKNIPENKVIEIINKLDMTQDVYLMSYNVDKLKRIKTNFSEFRIVLIKNILTSTDIELAYEMNAFGVSCGYFSSILLIDKAHKKGLKFWSGIINDPAKADYLLNMKVDGIVTDYPQLMTMNTHPQIFISPNPFSQILQIKLLEPEKVQKLLILNSYGAVVEYFDNPVTNPLIWNPSPHISNGTYFIYLINNERIIFEKILYTN